MDTLLLELCPIGQQLRSRANFQATCIRSAAWIREGVTPLERSNMPEMAHLADGDNFVSAFTAWQEHYHNCPTCQAALKRQTEGR